MGKSEDSSYLTNSDDVQTNGLERLWDILDRNKVSVAMLLIGLIIVGFGVFLYRSGFAGESVKIEILSSTSSVSTASAQKQIIVEISGQVEKPGVYKLDDGSRVEDLLIASGGLAAAADRLWVEKYINRAARLADGQKIYITKIDEQSTSSTAKNSDPIKADQGITAGSVSGLININTASLSELDTLPGIGQVYGQSIIDHRPYSDVPELLSKGALKQNVYDKIKDKVSVY